MRFRLWPSRKALGSREASAESILRIENATRRDGPTGVTGVQGPTVFREGEWYAFRLYRLIDDEAAQKRRIDEKTRRGEGIVRYPGKPLRDGLPLEDALAGVDKVDFYARVESDGTIGSLVLTEIPDPWLCAVCGKRYLEGEHTELGATGRGSHDYVARGGR